MFAIISLILSLTTLLPTHPHQLFPSHAGNYDFEKDVEDTTDWKETEPPVMDSMDRSIESEMESVYVEGDTAA